MTRLVGVWSYEPHPNPPKKDRAVTDYHDHHTPSAAEAVKSGARLIDKAHPDWATTINFDTLDLRASNYCVLGQVFGSYPSGIAALGFTMSVQPINAGFIATHNSREDLISAWGNEVRNRT